jgi:hypothetical protein
MWKNKFCESQEEKKLLSRILKNGNIHLKEKLKGNSNLEKATW